MSRPVRRGYVYRHQPTGIRVVVLSGDDFNDRPYSRRALVAPITRTATDQAGNEIPYLVNLTGADTVTGYVKVAETSGAAIDTLMAPEADEILSGATLDNVKSVLDEFLGY